MCIQVCNDTRVLLETHTTPEPYRDITEGVDDVGGSG